MTSRTKRFCGAATAAAVLLATALTGCSSAEPGDEKIELRYFDYQFNEPEHGKALTALIEEFETAHPNIEVLVESPPYDQYEAKLLAQGQAGQAPDVMKVLDGALTSIQASGMLKDLTADIDAAGGDTFMEPFYPILTEIATVDGGIYALPAWVGPYVLQYNADLLSEYGVDEADLASWDSFLDAVNQIKSDSGGEVNGYVVHGLKGETTVQRLLTWFFSNDAEILSSDLKSAAFNSAEGKEAFRFWAELAADGGPSPATVGPQQAREGFAAREVAMIQSYVWGIPIVESINPDIAGQSAIAPMPSPDGEPASSNLGAGYVAISKDTKYPEEAWELAQWMTSRDAGIAIWKQAMMFPARTDVVDDAEIAADPFYTATAAAAENLATFPHIAVWPQISGFLADAMQEVLVNGADPDAALDEAARKTDEVLSAG